MTDSTQDALHGTNPEYQSKVLAAAQKVNPDIPDDAVAIESGLKIDYAGLLDIENPLFENLLHGLTTKTELETLFESMRDAITLPKGYRHVVLQAGDTFYHVVMDHTDMPPVYLEG